MDMTSVYKAEQTKLAAYNARHQTISHWKTAVTRLEDLKAQFDEYQIQLDQSPKPDDRTFTAQSVAAYLKEQSKTREIHSNVLQCLEMAQNMLASTSAPKPATASNSSRVSLHGLPPELRATIWKFCLPDQDHHEPGIFFSKTCNFEKCSHTQPRGKYDRSYYNCYQEPVVDIAFPVIMHVCHESREFAEAHLRTRETTQRLWTLQVPCRSYLPDIDAFHVTPSDNGDYEVFDCLGPLSQKITHLVVDSFTFDEDDSISDGCFDGIFGHMTSLRRLSIIAEGPEDQVANAAADEISRLTDGLERLTPYKKVRAFGGWMGEANPVSEMVNALRARLSDIQVGDIQHEYQDPPWDKETGEPLFEIVVQSKVRVKGIF